MYITRSYLAISSPPHHASPNTRYLISDVPSRGHSTADGVRPIIPHPAFVGASEVFVTS